MSTTSIAKALFSKEEAAHYLSISVRKFESIVASECIPRKRIGSQVRFLVADLDRYIDSLPNLAGPRPGERGAD